VSVEANFGESASYTLSNRVQYDLDDCPAGNLTIYGTSAFKIQGDGVVAFLTVCDATFGDTACRSCNPWGSSTSRLHLGLSVPMSETRFDYEGIVDDRICAGVSFLDHYLEPGHSCYAVPENAEGTGFAKDDLNVCPFHYLYDLLVIFVRCSRWW
jgi:hypothetical protein